MEIVDPVISGSEGAEENLTESANVGRLGGSRDLPKLLQGENIFAQVRLDCWDGKLHQLQGEEQGSLGDAARGGANALKDVDDDFLGQRGQAIDDFVAECSLGSGEELTVGAEFGGVALERDVVEDANVVIQQDKAQKDLAGLSVLLIGAEGFETFDNHLMRKDFLEVHGADKRGSHA